MYAYYFVCIYTHIYIYIGVYIYMYVCIYTPHVARDVRNFSYLRMYLGNWIARDCHVSLHGPQQGSSSTCWRGRLPFYLGMLGFRALGPLLAQSWKDAFLFGGGLAPVQRNSLRGPGSKGSSLMRSALVRSQRSTYLHEEISPQNPWHWFPILKHTASSFFSNLDPWRVVLA